MPIEFRCPSCGGLLRVPDETAGRQAQCPQCGSQSTVPAATGSTPFPPGGLTPAPSAGAEAVNPFQSPSQVAGPVWMEGGPTREYALGRVAGPAIVLIVTGALGVVGNLLALLLDVVQFGLIQGGRGNIQADPAAAMALGSVGVVRAIIALMAALLVIAGAVKMKNLQSYGLAMTAAITAMIPCVGPCCLLGLPFGIWALVVLNDANVKAAFGR